jgi:feruloyl-CoA synthase
LKILKLRQDQAKRGIDQPMASATPAARAHDASAKAPIRPIAYAPARVEQIGAADGSILIRSAIPLGDYDPNLARMFRAAVDTAPSRTFLAERSGGDWRKISYEDTRQQIDRIAASLIERGLSADRPLMILSGNSINHALLTLAGISAGVPVAPISVAYSLQSQDFGKLKYIAELLAPGMVYVEDTASFAKALAALNLSKTEVVASRNGANLDGVTLLSDFTTPRPVGPVDAAIAAIRADTIAKILFTSGSTGLPKGVINTHRMLASNQQQIAQIWPFLQEQPIVLCDWLSWNHTFGANHNFNMVVRNAGTLYIDGGKPVPALIGETVQNLTSVSPTICFNVPAGYAALVPFLEKDEALAKNFFRDLRMIFYAAASLPQDIWNRLETVSARVTGKRVPMTSSWGATETAPLATAAHLISDRAGLIGVPVPGVELKLVPAGSKLEVRVRGPIVMPGYWKRPDLTKQAFDEDGFYRPGDAMRLADPADPSKGLMFDGRLAEDFKLTTGTFVHVGALRVNVLAACSPALHDAIIAGADQAYIAILAWLNIAGCQTIAGTGIAANPAELARHQSVRAHIANAIAKWNAGQAGSSTRIARVLLLSEPPSIDANEITDKGYINQRLVLERRKADVVRLYAPTPASDVIVI